MIPPVYFYPIHYTSDFRKRKEKTEKILEGLQKEQTENSKARASELAKDLELMDAVMKGYQIFDR